MKTVSKFQNNPTAAAVILRFGLAFVFAYAAIDSLAKPQLWEGYMPAFLAQRFNVHPLMMFFTIVELLVAAWLLSGKLLRLASVTAALMLAGITMSNLSNFLVTFRDIGLLAMALALYAIAKQ